MCFYVCFLMIRRPPRSTRTDTLFPYTTLVRSAITADYVVNCAGMWGRELGLLAGVRVPLQACEHFYIVTEEIPGLARNLRSEEHTSELQSLMRISYAVFCLKKKKQITHTDILPNNSPNSI